MRQRGHIYKRPGLPGYYVNYTIRGKRHYKGGFSSKSMARTWIHRMLLNAQRDEALGVEPLAAEVTFNAFLPRWKAALRPTLTDNTYEGYIKVASGLLAPFFGKMKVHEISPLRVQAYITARSEAGASAPTINRNLCVLASIMKTALVCGCTRINPVAGIKRTRETIRPMPYLTHEDELRLLAALPAWLRTGALVSLEAGLRSGEILRLTRRDIDFQRRVLTVRISKNKSPRMVGLNPRLAAALRAHLETIPASAEPVFVRADGTPIPVNTWRTLFRRAAAKAGLTGFRFHDLRHMHGTRLAERGAPPAMIRMALGHKCLAATLRYIDHAPSAFSVKAAFLLAEQTDAAAASLPAAPPLPHPPLSMAAGGSAGG